MVNCQLPRRKVLHFLEYPGIRIKALVRFIVMVTLD